MMAYRIWVTHYGPWGGKTWIRCNRAMIDFCEANAILI